MNTAHDKGKHTTQHSRHVHQLKIGPRQSTIHRNLKTFKYHFHIFSLMHSNRPPEYTHGSLTLWLSPSPTGEYSTRSQTVSSTSSTSIGRRIDIQLGQYPEDLLHSTAWDRYTRIPLREYYITNRDLPTHRINCSYNLTKFDVDVSSSTIGHVIYIITTLSVLTKHDDGHEWPKHVVFLIF